MGYLYAECPYGHQHRAVNIPDDPQAWLDFICNQVTTMTPEEVARRTAGLEHPPQGQHFYVQVKDLRPL